MDDSNPYLESQIMTATPQKLRLLLIEGAIRFARQTLELWEKEQNDQALEAYRQALRLQPNHANAYAGLGLIYIRARQVGQAKEAYQQALRLNPNLRIKALCRQPCLPRLAG